MFLTDRNGVLPIYFGSHYSYLALRNVSFWSLAGTMVFDVTNRPSAASHSRGTKSPCWREKVALGQDKQRKLPFQIMHVFCLSCPSATFALQRGGFIPREWLAAKGPLFRTHVCLGINSSPNHGSYFDED